MTCSTHKPPVPEPGSTDLVSADGRIHAPPLIPHRRERILDAAEHLVLSQGFAAMNVAAVAEQAGIAKGAIYLEFASKRDIREALLRRGADRMNTAVTAQLTEEHPALSHASRVTVRALLTEPLMVAAFLHDEGILGVHAEGVTDDRFQTHHRMIVDRIADLQSRGRFASTVTPLHLGLALSSATVGILSAARPFGPITAEQLEGALSALADMIALLETPDTDTRSERMGVVSRPRTRALWREGAADDENLCQLLGASAHGECCRSGGRMRYGIPLREPAWPAERLQGWLP